MHVKTSTRRQRAPGERPPALPRGGQATQGPAAGLGAGLASLHEAPDCSGRFYCPVISPVSANYLAEGEASVQSQFTAESLFLF